MGVHNNGTVCSRRCIFHYRFILFIVKKIHFIILSKDVLEMPSHAPAHNNMFQVSVVIKRCVSSVSVCL